LVQLAGMCDMPHSEIYKVEIGQQECRIETLLKLCTELGITAGWILDRALWSDPAAFKHVVTVDSATEGLWRVLGLDQGGSDSGASIRPGPEGAIQGHLVNTLCMACSRAAVLLRASDPWSLVRADDYPHVQWRERFLNFAEELVKAGGDSLERASVLRELFFIPVITLQRQKLLAEDALRAEAANYSLPRNERADFSWTAESPLRESAGSATPVQASKSADMVQKPPKTGTKKEKNA